MISQFDALIRRDPARRGLIGSEPQFGPLCPGHLALAAEHLARSARRVVIVTGFFIPRGDPPAAETDGPPGALLLADALHLAGIETSIVTDGYCHSAVIAAAGEQGYPLDRIVRYPHPADAALDRAAWRETFFNRGPGRDLSHLIAIERVGPSHTLESLRLQHRDGPIPIDRFVERVPTGDRDHCHNMRGENIDPFAGDVHRLFEDMTRFASGVRTIGIGDGANEIGMGAVPWEELERRLSGEQAARVPCRVATDWNIIAGTSNCGAQALAAAVMILRSQSEFLRPFDGVQQERVLKTMVARGPAVDGVTRRQEPTVDGLLFETYIQPWIAMRRLMEIDEK